MTGNKHGVCPHHLFGDVGLPEIIDEEAK